MKLLNIQSKNKMYLDDAGVVCIEIEGEKHGRQYAKVDRAMANLVAPYQWRLEPSGGSFLAVTDELPGVQSKLYLHDLVMGKALPGFSPGDTVDEQEDFPPNSIEAFESAAERFVLTVIDTETTVDPGGGKWHDLTILLQCPDRDCCGTLAVKEIFADGNRGLTCNECETDFLFAVKGDAGEIFGIAFSKLVEEEPTQMQLTASKEIN